MTSRGSRGTWPQHSDRLIRLLTSWPGEAGAAVALACAGFVAGLGGVRSQLPAALNSGDMLMAYVGADLMSSGGYFGGTRLGFPLGMDLRYFPTADHLPSSVAALLTALTGNPFFGVNAVWAMSFPVTALAALWLMRLVGLRGPLAVLGALVVTFTPFHWERTYHVWLATSYSAVLAVCLAVLVGSGRWSEWLAGRHRRRAVVLMAVLCALLATGGIYYAAFAVLLTSVAVVWRWTRGAGWRALALDAAPVVGVVALLAVALLPAWLFLRANPSFVPIAARYPWESVAYSGVLTYALLPSPVSHLPGLADYVGSVVADGQLAPTGGVQSSSDMGTLLTTASWALGVGGTAWLARRARRCGSAEAPAPGEAGPGLVAVLLAATVLFFVPWGLNYVFAATLSPQIRGWDRLVTVLLTLFVALAGVTLRRFGAGRWGARTVAVVTAAGLVVLAVDAVWPYRAGTTSASAAARAEQVEAAAYGERLNAAVPGRCGVLQLPYVAYPEVAPVEQLGAYDHAWVALTNTEKSWSFGASKSTFDTGWVERLGDRLDRKDLEDLAAGGFCAVHVDLRGYTAQTGLRIVGELTDLLGAPVADGHGGVWQAFALPGWSGPISERDLESLPEGLQDFYAPLHVADPVGAVQDGDGWLVTESEATLVLRTGDSDATFGSVELPVSAPACAGRDVTVTVRTPAGEAEGSARVPAGGAATVSVELPTRVDTADVVVTATGEACGTDGLLDVGAPSRVG